MATEAVQELGVASGLTARPQPEGLSIAAPLSGWVASRPDASNGYWHINSPGLDHGDVATVWSGGADGDARAAAMLMASAPELLAALRDLQARFVETSETYRGYCWTYGATENNAATVAINKAEGRS